MKQCKKVRYKTKKEAKKALKEVRKTPLYLKGRFIKKARQYYKCPICSGFHITSSK
jgi:hypothetical protein